MEDPILMQLSALKPKNVREYFVSICILYIQIQYFVLYICIPSQIIIGIIFLLSSM